MATIPANCPICGRCTPQSLLRAATAASPPLVQCGTCSTMWEMLQDGTPRCQFEGGETAIFYERDFRAEVVRIVMDGIAAVNAGVFPLFVVEGEREVRRSVWGRYLRCVTGNTFVSHFADFLGFLSRDPQFVKGGWMLHDHPILLRGIDGEVGRVLLPSASDVWVANIGEFSVSVCADTHYEAMQRLSVALRRSLEFETPCLSASLSD